MIVAGIVTYNSQLDMLVGAIESLAAYCDRIYIIDNASTQEYRTELARLITKYGNVSLIYNQSNIGFGAAHNIAINKAGVADYYIAVNPDIIAKPNTISIMREYMTNHPEVGLIVPKITNPDGSLQPQNKRYPNVLDLFVRRFCPSVVRDLPYLQKRLTLYSMLDYDYDKIMEPEFASGCFMMFRMNLLQKVSGFDERFFLYFEDADITRRISKHAKVIYYPEVSVIHHWQRGSHKNIKLCLVMITSAARYFHKWGWKWL